MQRIHFSLDVNVVMQNSGPFTNDGYLSRPTEVDMENSLNLTYKDFHF